MAANFSISVHRNSENLHLKLTGDFDETAALELANLLKKSSKKGIFKIIIHTSCLNNIVPFGRDTFQTNLYFFSDHFPGLLFTGKHANQIAPEKSLCL